MMKRPRGDSSSDVKKTMGMWSDVGARPPRWTRSCAQGLVAERRRAPEVSGGGPRGCIAPHTRTFFAVPVRRSGFLDLLEIGKEAC